MEIREAIFEFIKRCCTYRKSLVFDATIYGCHIQDRISYEFILSSRYEQLEM